MAQDLSEIINSMQMQINALTQQQIQAIQPLPVEEHTDMTFNITRAEDVSLQLFKTLPEFSGDRNSYATWRTIVKTAMKLLENFETSMQFCQALMIIRNKITGAASNILNNYNTPFNFEAIMDRLDFTYADKRPLYVLEQEMLILQQQKSTVDEFFDRVNEKLNAIVNKINMTYSDKDTAKVFIETINEKALRTFITGLNNRKGEILYASNPKTLPEAYARLQTISNDQERMKFAARYNANSNIRNETFLMKNPRFRLKEYGEEKAEKKEHEPMEIDQASTKVHFDPKPNQLGASNRYQATPFKRNLSHQTSAPNQTEQRFKQQRLNKMEEKYEKTIMEENENEDVESCLSETMTSSSSSIFLGE